MTDENKSQQIIELKIAIETIHADLAELKQSNKKILDLLTDMAVLRFQQAETDKSLGRAFTEIEAANQKIDSIRQSLPRLEQAAGFVFKALIGAVGILGAIALAIITDNFEIPPVNKSPYHHNENGIRSGEPSLGGSNE